jgi:hypothetical protein
MYVIYLYLNIFMLSKIQIPAWYFLNLNLPPTAELASEKAQKRNSNKDFLMAV